jgi:hypothetical protein
VIDKQALLNRVKSLWPDAITLRPDGGQEALNSIYWPLEEGLEDHGDEWIGLGAWAFHQALGELAQIKAKAGRAALRPADVSLEAFDRWMRNNLSDESWSEVRKEYDADLD